MKPRDLYEEVEQLKASGTPRYKSFAAIAERESTTSRRIQEAYYRYRESIQSEQPQSLASQIRGLAAYAQELEDRLKAYEAIEIPPSD